MRTAIIIFIFLNHCGLAITQNFDWPFVGSERVFKSSINISPYIEDHKGVIYITPEIVWERAKSQTYIPVPDEVGVQICEQWKLFRDCNLTKMNFYNYLTIPIGDVLNLGFVLGQSHYNALDRVYMNVIRKSDNKILSSEIVCDNFGDVGSYKKVKCAVVKWKNEWYVRRYWKVWRDDSLDGGMLQSEYKINTDNLTIFVINSYGLTIGLNKDGI